MKILSIETSCDETSIAILEFSGAKRMPRVRVLSHIVSSQVKLHAKYGGVVPNLAKREHQKNLPLILKTALKEAGDFKSKVQSSNAKSNQKSKVQILESILEREPELLRRFRKSILPLAAPNIDAIAVTIGPGLAPCLWVGVNFARALACLWDKPVIPVNHMMGHFFSALVSPARKKSKVQNPNVKSNPKFKIQKITRPAIGLLVSGGHTELVLSKRWGQYEIIGETLDDAAGEAFDKVARILGLGYPGGPAIAAIAAQTQSSKLEVQSQNVKLKIELPRPMINSKNFNFSFSGLKTAALYLVRDLKKAGRPLKILRPLIAREFQNAVVDVLVSKTVRAAREYKAKTILLGGGVAANALLREQLVQKILPPTTLHLPPTFLTGDNAFMIGLAAYFSGKKRAPDMIGADANMRLS